MSFLLIAYSGALLKQKRILDSTISDSISNVDCGIILSPLEDSCEHFVEYL